MPSDTFTGWFSMVADERGYIKMGEAFNYDLMHITLVERMLVVELGRNNVKQGDDNTLLVKTKFTFNWNDLPWGTTEKEGVNDRISVQSL